jgi:hypothetical protein
VKSTLSQRYSQFPGLAIRCKLFALINFSIVAGVLEKVVAFTLKDLNKFAQLKTCVNTLGVHAISKN